MGTSCKKIHIRKKIRKKIQEDTFHDPVSTPYGKANSSLRPDSFLKSLVILKISALAVLVQKFVRMTSDFKKLFTGPGKNYILPQKSKIYFLVFSDQQPRASAHSPPPPASLPQGRELVNDKQSRVMIMDRSLVLPNVSRHQAGSYTCGATNVEGHNQSRPLLLQIMCEYAVWSSG